MIPSTEKLRVDMALLKPGDVGRQNLSQEAPTCFLDRGERLQKRQVEGWERARHGPAVGPQPEPLQPC